VLIFLNKFTVIMIFHLFTKVKIRFYWMLGCADW